jgi:two-component system CitB family sensor kinase
VLLQVCLVAAAVVAAAAVAVLQARSDVREQAGRRCLSIAQTLAATGLVADSVRTADPTTALQPLTRRVTADTGVDFITIMSPAGIRFTHPDPTQIGLHYLGTITPALGGGTVVETYTGTLGPSVRAVVPVRARAGSPVIALVAVGVRVEKLGSETARRIGLIALLGGVLLALALVGSALIGRRVNRQTRGLGAAELGLMHTYYDAVLHSVREGMLLLDASGAVRLINAEARRLLGISGDPVGRPVGDLGLPAELVRVLAMTESVVDSVLLTGDRVLVVSALPARVPARSRDQQAAVGRVISLRDHTEMTELTSELGTARDLTEALKSQSHEAANRLHAVITLVELGRPAEAVDFATDELQLAQQLTDQVVGCIADPVLAAVLLGKAQVAAERGITFELTTDSAVDDDALVDAGLEVREVVTVVGNLIDNALEAVSRCARPGHVRVRIGRTDPESDEMTIEVADNGPGMDSASAEHASRRGWSTKPDDGMLHGHGLGLGLVGQVAHRHGGRVSVSDNDPGAVFRVTVGR